MQIQMIILQSNMRVTFEEVGVSLGGNITVFFFRNRK